jgi:fluoride exporter
LPITNALIVGAGGFVGSILRYWLSGFAHRWTDAFPVGTLAVNVVGCLVIGAFWSAAEFGGWFRPETRLLVTTGVLGGFTTFSAFGYETFALVNERQYWAALGNVSANVVLGFAAVALGWMAGKALTV